MAYALTSTETILVKASAYFYPPLYSVYITYDTYKFNTCKQNAYKLYVYKYSVYKLYIVVYILVFSEMIILPIKKIEF